MENCQEERKHQRCAGLCERPLRPPFQPFLCLCFFLAWSQKVEETLSNLLLTKLCQISLAATHNHPPAFLPLACNAAYAGCNGSICPPNIRVFFPVMT